MEKNHYDFVIDCSVAMAWCFEDERNAYTDNILENIQDSVAVVPTIWPLEVSQCAIVSKEKEPNYRNSSI